MLAYVECTFYIYNHLFQTYGNTILKINTDFCQIIFEMNRNTTNFTMDERWSLWVPDADFNKFKEIFIPDLYLKREVPDDIREMYKLIERILELSYFEYELYDIAMLKSFHAVEAILRLKFKELNPDYNKRIILAKIVEWFQENNYFEGDIEFMKLMVDIRNHNSHPEKRSFGGGLMKQWIEPYTRLYKWIV